MEIISEIKEKSDEELVEMAKKSPDQYRFLMERHQKALFRFIQRITNLSKEDAEDILQESFIKMYRNLNDYDQKLKFSSWAYRIAHNAAIDHLRKINIRPRQISINEYDFTKIIPSKIDIANEIADKNLKEKILSLLQEIPIKYREVLVLRFIEEKSYEEIMDILKKPKGTVATLIDRGRKILTQKIKL